MFERRENEDDNLFRLRLTARVFAAACLAILFLFTLGENLDDLLNTSARDLVGMLFFPVGLMLGFLIAWRREVLGGLISFASILAHYFVYGWLLSGSLTETWWSFFFAIPGILFAVYGIAATGGQTLSGKKTDAGIYESRY